MSLFLRRVHLYLALFLVPWVLMYTASTFVMNHRHWFHETEPAPPPRFEIERELTYSGDFPENPTPRQIALQLLPSLDLDGAFNLGRPAAPGAIVINRLHPTHPRRITYNPATKHVTVEKMVFTGAGFLERMHRRRGFQHDYLLEDLWASSVDLTIAALFLLALSGLWMWWELKITRRPGALALAAGVALFSLFLAVM